MLEIDYTPQEPLTFEWTLSQCNARRIVRKYAPRFYEDQETCHGCGGSGKRYEQDWDDKRIWDVHTCKTCQGRGWLEG